VKKVAPRVSLLTLFVAVEFVDILWPFLLLFNVEQVKIHPGFTEVTPFEFVHYPYTHSLVMGVVWGLVAGLVYWFFQKDSRSALVVGLAVLSHWFLDFVVHTADLPLTLFGETKVGLGLWNSFSLTLIIESILFFAGVYLYATSTKALNNKGKWGLWSLVAFFVAANYYNLFGPPPEDSIPVLFVSFTVLQVIILWLAHLTDKNRAATA
jgi:membrane-bound metal-dependent hydrolase YbcI (DUF457 family)